MKSLLALLLASACFQAQSANLPPCDKAVRFSAAWFADPEVDNAKPAAELTKIGAGAGRSGTQLGHVVVETKLAVMPQTHVAPRQIRGRSPRHPRRGVRMQVSGIPET
mgnify:CR=1 FL=1